MENSFSPEDHTVIIKQIAEAYGVSLLGIEPIVSNTGELMPLAVDYLEPSMEAQAAIERYLSTVMSSKCQWGGPEMQIVDDPDVVTEPRPPRLDVKSQKGPFLLIMMKLITGQNHEKVDISEVLVQLQFASNNEKL